MSEGSRDQISQTLALYATKAPWALEGAIQHQAKRLLVDSLGVALGALEHPAALAARRYAELSPNQSDGCRIWGTCWRSLPDTAALVNGVLMRCYDFNDLGVGERAGGHPSDMVPGLIAVAEARGLGGAELLSAMAVGYEVLFALFDGLANNEGGWDYTNLTSIAATCAVGRLMGLSSAVLSEAVGITATTHLVTDEVESRELNRHGDLTMWKRFNGAHAIKLAVYSCQLASVGTEAVVRPFLGRGGYLSRISPRDDFENWFAERLDPGSTPSRIADVTLKRWPVGSRGQSTIQSALSIHSKLGDPGRIRIVRILTEEATYDHLVRQQKVPWSPISRETADHSLPYIAAVALLDGEITTSSFDLGRIATLKAQSFLKKVEVTSVPRAELGAAATSSDAALGFLTRIEVVTEDGVVLVGEALPPAGHQANPLTDDDLAAKLCQSAISRFGAAATERLLERLWSAERQPVAAIAEALVPEQGA